MKEKTILLISMLLLLLGLAGCSSSTGAVNLVTQTPYVIVITLSPTADMGGFETQVAATIYAGLTETASAMPTETPLPPTDTPEPSSTPTKTATPTKTTVSNNWVPQNPQWYPPAPPQGPTASSSSSAWRCSITYQLVGYNEVFGTYEDFDAKWTIKNTGTAYWDSGAVDYFYSSGTEMHKYADRYDLPATVSPGYSITLTVDMQAPGSEGSYSTYWTLSGDSGTFCTLPVHIRVED